MRRIPARGAEGTKSSNLVAMAVGDFYPPFSGATSTTQALSGDNHLPIAAVVSSGVTAF